MMTLIIGGSGSGKSEYAENYISEISKDCRKYYLAAMQVYDEESQKKVDRHRKKREGKGFQTIEQPVKIEEVLGKIEQMERDGKPVLRTALLECISNLTANEMFSGEKVKDRKTVQENIISGIQKLYAGVEHLVIVSNNVFEDGRVYDETTMEYIRAMGSIHEELAKMADMVIEVVVGIPITICTKIQ